MPSSNAFHHFALADFFVLREGEGEVIDVDRLLESARKVERELDGQTHRILIDARGATKDYSYADAYRVVQVFKDAPGHRSGHIAIVGDYDHDFEKAQAMEYFYQEAGIDVRAFLDYEKAEVWLTDRRPGATRP